MSQQSPEIRKLHSRLNNLSDIVREGTLSIAITKGGISEKALIKIANFTEDIWSRIRSELLRQELLQETERIRGYKMLRFDALLCTCMEDSISKEEYKTLLYRHAQYYLELSTLIRGAKRGALYDAALEEVRHFQIALQTLVNIGKEDLTLQFINNLSGLRSASSSLSQFLKTIEDTLSIKPAYSHPSKPATPSPNIRTIKASKLNWKLLPQGHNNFRRILTHYEALQASDDAVQYDLARLETIYNLKPSSTYIGSDEFNGFVLFYFQEKRLAILECPLVGNAVYIIKGDWQSLSKYSKSDLLTKYSDKVVRIIHSGDWLKKLRKAILQ